MMLVKRVLTVTLLGPPAEMLLTQGSRAGHSLITDDATDARKDKEDLIMEPQRLNVLQYNFS